MKDLIDAKVSIITNSVSLKRDFQLLKVLEMQERIGLLDQATTSICLFDIFRGVFTDSKNRVTSSSVNS